MRVHHNFVSKYGAKNRGIIFLGCVMNVLNKVKKRKTMYCPQMAQNVRLTVEYMDVESIIYPYQAVIQSCSHQHLCQLCQLIPSNGSRAHYSFDQCVLARTL